MTGTDDEQREAQRRAEAKRRLREALDGVELVPEETRDDRAIREAQAKQEADRDAEFVRNKPPHHG